jgi:hypothetical protein
LTASQEVLRPITQESRPGWMMIQDGKLFCNICEQQIHLAEKPSTQVLLELVKGETDRHYCENCVEAAQSPSRRPVGSARPETQAHRDKRAK